MQSATNINPNGDLEATADKILAELRDDLIDSLANASHAAFNSTDKMNASFSGTATIAKKIKRGGDVSHTLFVDSRVRIPSEKASWDLEFNEAEQLRLNLA